MQYVAPSFAHSTQMAQNKTTAAITVACTKEVVQIINFLDIFNMVEISNESPTLPIN